MPRNSQYTHSFRFVKSRGNKKRKQHRELLVQKEKCCFRFDSVCCTDRFFQPHPSWDNLQWSPLHFTNAVHRLQSVSLRHRQASHGKFPLCIMANPDSAFENLFAFCVAHTVLQAVTMMPTAYFSRCNIIKG